MEKNLNIKISEELHQKYKIYLATKGVLMKQDIIAYIESKTKKEQ